MNIIAVDDEQLALRDLKESIEDAVPGAALTCFRTADEALAFARVQPVDVAFLDVEMAETNGITLALALKEIRGQTNIIFVTGHADYMGSAFSMHASGYVFKPANRQKILKELENLRHPIIHAEMGPLHIKCFGSFEVFVDGKPLPFSRSKSKELLAYLVNQYGSGVTTAKIAAILWEDKVYNRSLQKQTQTIISQMMAVLKAAGIDDIIIKNWNSLAVDTSRFTCDYYDFLRGDVAALNAYTGEYMGDYSWAEFTAGLLTEATRSLHG